MEKHEVCEQLEALHRQLFLIGQALDELKETIQGAQNRLQDRLRAFPGNPLMVLRDQGKELIAIDEKCKGLDTPLVIAKTKCKLLQDSFSGNIEDSPDCGLQR
jgi:hypothetical protein